MNETKTPEYVYYDLLKEHAVDNNVSRSGSFVKDTEITLGTASTSDYTNSGYDRGHLANCDDFRYDMTAMRTTFLMSNIAPQLPAYNRGGAWRESEIQGDIYAVAFGHVEIITGPIYKSENPIKIGKTTKISVPDGFFKIFYNKDNMLLEAYIIYQDDYSNRLDTYKVSVEDVEKATGLKFEFK